MYLMTGDSIKYLCGLLNSRTVSWFFDNICGESGVGTNRWIKIYVHQLPIPFITVKNRQIAEQIEGLVEQILTAKKANPNADTNALEDEIDQLVYELYELTEEEIAIVEESVR